MGSVQGGKCNGVIGGHKIWTLKKSAHLYIRAECHLNTYMHAEIHTGGGGGGTSPLQKSPPPPLNQHKYYNVILKQQTDNCILEQKGMHLHLDFFQTCIKTLVIGTVSWKVGGDKWFPLFSKSPV